MFITMDKSDGKCFHIKKVCPMAKPL